MGGDPLKVNEFSEHGPFRIAIEELEADLKSDLAPEDEAAIIDSYEARSEMRVLPGTPAEQQLGETLIRYANDLMRSPEDVPADLDEWLSDMDNLPAGSPPKVRFMLTYKYIKLAGQFADQRLASQAGRVAIAIERSKFNSYQLSNLQSVLDLFNHPETEKMAVSLLNLIEISPDFEPAIPYGFDVLVRKAGETPTAEIGAWHRRLQWVVEGVGMSRGFLGQRILNDVIEASSSERYNLRFLYERLFRNNIGTHLRYTERNIADSWNLLLRLSSLRYQSMLVLLQNGHTEIVRRFLNILKIWQGPPHGIVDVFIHVAASVPPSDSRRMGYVLDMLRVVENQAQIVENLEHGFTEDPEKWNDTLRMMEEQASEVQIYAGASGDDGDLLEELGRMAEQQVRPIARYVDRLEVLGEARFAWFENNSIASSAEEFYERLRQLLKTSGSRGPFGSGAAPAASSPSAPPAQSGGHAASAMTDFDEEEITGIEAAGDYGDEVDVGSFEDLTGEEDGVFGFDPAPIEAGGTSVYVEAFPL